MKHLRVKGAMTGL